MTWAADFQTAALAPLIAKFGVSVTILDTDAQTSYVRNVLRWQLEGFGDPFNEWHYIVYNDATLGVTAPANGWTITYSGTEYVVGKVTSRGNGAVWDLWTREPEERV